MDEAKVRALVAQAVDQELSKTKTQPKTKKPADDRVKRRNVVTEEEVRATPVGGTLTVAPGSLVTPLAATLAGERQVRIVEAGSTASPAAPAAVPGLPPVYQRIVALGADHGGFALKEDLKTHLTNLGYRVWDLGTNSETPVDYPDFAFAVARVVGNGEAWRGIIVDGAGIGSCMTANKVPGVRAAMCYDVTTARNAREHNDANVLTLGGRLIARETARAIVQTFLEANCTEERHQKRVAKIMAIEGRFLRG